MPYFASVATKDIPPGAVELVPRAAHRPSATTAPRPRPPPAVAPPLVATSDESDAGERTEDEGVDREADHSDDEDDDTLPLTVRRPTARRRTPARRATAIDFGNDDESDGSLGGDDAPEPPLAARSGFGSKRLGLAIIGKTQARRREPCTRMPT